MSVVLGLATGSLDGHLESVAQLANIFNDSSAVEELEAAPGVEQVLRIMGETGTERQVP